MKKDKTDFLTLYRQADADGRFDLMMANFTKFPGIIKNAEVKTMYRIRSEREYLRSRSRDELGVRVQGSGMADTTSEEAMDMKNRQSGGLEHTPQQAKSHQVYTDALLANL